MRVRRKGNREKRLESCKIKIIENPVAQKGNWTSLFQNHNPIHLEIGCGKGGFITQLALLHPELNFIAVEKCVDVLISAVEKAIQMNLPNLFFISGDAGLLTEIFQPGECQRIYLNFSDPWPKSGHKKRRLTHRNFLGIYQQLLPENGELHFKTDNRGLFEFSLNEFSDLDLKMKHISLDLHHSNFEGNIETEYEHNFSIQGFPIYRCEVIFNRTTDKSALL